MKSGILSAVAGLEEIFDDQRNGHLGPGDVAGSVPDPQRSYEKKFVVGPQRESIGERELRFQARLFELLKAGDFVILDSAGYTGVDQYFRSGGNGETVYTRLRLSSNQSCRKSTKIRTGPRGNQVKRQVDIWIPYRDFESERQSLIWQGKTSKKFAQFRIGQVGKIWMVRDRSGHVVEIVLYQAARSDIPSQIQLFAEIDPRNCPNEKIANGMTSRYAKLLGLRQESRMGLAEMFGPS